MQYLRNFYPYSGVVNYYIFTQQTRDFSPNSFFLNRNQPVITQIKELRGKVRTTTVEDFAVSLVFSSFYKFAFKSYSRLVVSLGLVPAPSKTAILQHNLDTAKQKLLQIERTKIDFMSQDELLSGNSQSIELENAEKEKLCIKLREHVKTIEIQLSNEMKRDSKYPNRQKKEEVMNHFLAFLSKITSDALFFPIQKITVWNLSQTDMKTTWLQTAKRFFGAKGVSYYCGYLPQFLITTLSTIVATPFVRFVESVFRIPKEDLFIKEIMSLLPHSLDYLESFQDEEIVSILDKNKKKIVSLFRFHAKRSFAGVITDWIIQLSFYPLIVLKNILMAQGSSELCPYRFADTLDAIQTIYSQNGINGFYRGYRVYSFTIIPQLITMGVFYVIFSIAIEMLLVDPQDDNQNADDFDQIEIISLQKQADQFMIDVNDINNNFDVIPNHQNVSIHKTDDEEEE